LYEPSRLLGLDIKGGVAPWLHLPIVRGEDIDHREPSMGVDIAIVVNREVFLFKAED
jgi:hypothetical protein